MAPGPINCESGTDGSGCDGQSSPRSASSLDQHSPNNERGSKIDDANLFNGKAAEGKGIKGLDTILRHQFGDVREEAQGEGDRTPKTQLEEDKARRMSLASESFAEDMAKQKKGYKESLLALISSGAFTGFFLLLTMYTFYAPDLDVIFGGKESEVVMGVTMTVTLAFFLLELVLNSIAKPQYVCRFPFWLDLAASLSLLPETWMWKQILRSNFIASGDESITRFLMLAARSTRVSRLQRLTRLMRIAALLPRITQQLQRVNRQLEADARTLLDKKLHRVFAFLDQDYDGKISHSALKEVLRRFDPAMRKSTNSRRKITNLSFFSGKTSIRSISDVEEAGEEELRPEDRSKASRQVSEHSMGAKQLRFTEEQEVNRELSNFSIGIPIPRAKTDGTETQDSEEEPLERIESSASNTSEHLPFHDRDAGHKSTKSSVASWISEDLKGVTFDEFREQILAEDWVDKQLLSVCRNELMKTSYMHKERVKQMEDIGVKVALGVLCNILVVSLFSWSFTDFSARLSLSMLDAQGRRFPDVQTLPESLQDSVLLWSQSLDPQSLRGSLIFLDVAQRTVCNELDQGVSCTAEHDPWPWPERGSLTAVDQAFQRSSHRQSDVVLLRVPDDSERSAATSLEDLNRSVTSLALLNMRYLQEQNAIFSVAVTTTAIILILVGIYVFTREISVLSSGLLRPLRLLADDMQSVTQMQLAGLQSNKAVMEFDRNVAEIRLIEGIFEKTKTAIRSWGKYVPWPVVQILLAAGIDSALKLATTDVTMFFSDIASFTTIVEKLPPERSLVLLSRYFNDMSQVIDNHGGIVIEFIGDAILSVFGAPLRNPMHADACVRATLKMLKALDRINAWSKHRSLPQVNIRCGVHTGEVLVGNMGFHSRIKYGTMGENANVPSKLEEFNKTYSTFNLISEDTYLSLPPETFIVRPIDCIYLRNSDPEPTTVYNVLGFNESAEKMGKTERIEKMSQVYQDAYNNYRRQSFKKASDLFQKYVRMSKKMGPQDSAAQLMQKRCKFYLENPPSREWDGVWDQVPLQSLEDDSDDELLDRPHVMSTTAPLPFRSCLSGEGGRSDRQWYTRQDVPPRVPALPKWLRQQIQQINTEARSPKFTVSHPPKAEAVRPQRCELPKVDQAQQIQAVEASNQDLQGQRRGGEMVFIPADGQDVDDEEGLHARRRIRWRLLVKLRPKRKSKVEAKPAGQEELRLPEEAKVARLEEITSPIEEGFEDLEGGPFAGRLENSKKKRNQAFKEISLKSDKNARIQRLNNRRKQMYKGQEDEDSSDESATDAPGPGHGRRAGLVVRKPPEQADSAEGQLLLEAFRRYDRLEEGILCMKDVRSCLADIGIHPSLPPEKRAVTEVLMSAQPVQYQENGLDFYVIMTLVPKIWEAIATAKRQDLEYWFSRSLDENGVYDMQQLRPCLEALGLRIHDEEWMEVERIFMPVAKKPQKKTFAKSVTKVLFEEKMRKVKGPEKSPVHASDMSDFDIFQKSFFTVQEHLTRRRRRLERQLCEEYHLTTEQIEEFRADLVPLDFLFRRFDRHGQRLLSEKEVLNLLVACGADARLLRSDLMPSLMREGRYLASLAQRGGETMEPKRSLTAATVQSAGWKRLQKVARPRGWRKSMRQLDFAGPFQGEDINFFEFLYLMMFLRQQSREVQLDDFRSFFQRLEKDKLGNIAMKEAMRLFPELGLSPRSRLEQLEIKQVLNEVDEDGTGALGWSEFTQVVLLCQERLERLVRQDEENYAVAVGFTVERCRELRKIFLDSKNEWNVMEMPELRRAMTLMQRPYKSEELLILFNNFNRGGHMDFRSFIKMMQAIDILKTEGHLWQDKRKVQKALSRSLTSSVTTPLF